MISIDNMTDEDFERHAFAILQRELGRGRFGPFSPTQPRRIWRLHPRSSQLAKRHNHRGHHGRAKQTLRFCRLEEQNMSVSVNIPEELYAQARAIAEAQNIAIEDVFASAFADHFATWQSIRERAARGDRDNILLRLISCRMPSRRATAGYNFGKAFTALVCTCN